MCYTFPFAQPSVDVGAVWPPAEPLWRVSHGAETICIFLESEQLIAPVGMLPEHLKWNIPVAFPASLTVNDT